MWDKNVVFLLELVIKNYNERMLLNKMNGAYEDCEFISYGFIAVFNLYG